MRLGYYYAGDKWRDDDNESTDVVVLQRGGKVNYKKFLSKRHQRMHAA